MSRDSLMSTSTNTTYPSTHSSFDRSGFGLGLTDSPLPPLPNVRHLTSRHQESEATQAQSAPASPWQRRRTKTPGPEDVQPPHPSTQSPSRQVQQTRTTAQSPSRQSQAPRPPPQVPRKQSHQALRSSQSSNSLHAVAEEGVLDHRYSSEHLGQPRRAVVKQRSNLSDSTTPSRSTSAGEATTTSIPSQPTPAGDATRRRERRATPTQRATPTPTDASGRPIAVPRRRSTPRNEDTPTPTKSRPSASQARPQATRRPSKPDADEMMAKAWEAELIRNAGNLQIEDDGLRQHREELRKKDREWETSGMWESHEEAARKGEERTRRDASREIAYPPIQPRATIRAAPSGVTSVHIGIRPRVHPNRADESLVRNQPDQTLSEPLFSPEAGQSAALPGDTVKGSYNTRYTTELMDKAKAEYDAWLARKSEREGGVGEDQGGVRDFVPRDRSIALPRALGGQQPLESWDEPRKTAKSATSSDGASVATPLEGAPVEGGYPWNGYGYPPQATGDTADPSQAYGYSRANMQIPPGWTHDDVAQWYAAQQAYWNPYWWSQGMQGMPGMESGQMSQDEGVAGEATEAQKAATGKVHFANSPDKTRVKKIPSNVSLQQDYADQGMYPDP